MKKILLLLCIFVGSFLIFLRIHASNLQKNNKYTLSTISPSSIQRMVSPTRPAVGIPMYISIPAIRVNAAVEQVGMDDQGRMDVPSNNVDTAWYKLGYKPGEKGSAVIDGHFDTVTGAPAVFYNITKLTNGDTITVTDSLNHTYTFIVTQVTSYPFNQLPMQQIFASTDRSRLNLITCDGVWNRQAHNYSSRAVIYSVLANP